MAVSLDFRCAKYCSFNARLIFGVVKCAHRKGHRFRSLFRHTVNSVYSSIYYPHVCFGSIVREGSSLGRSLSDQKLKKNPEHIRQQHNICAIVRRKWSVPLNCTSRRTYGQPHIHTYIGQGSLPPHHSPLTTLLGRRIVEMLVHVYIKLSTYGVYIHRVRVLQ